MSSVDTYRRRAAACQRQADTATLESVRETLQDIAQKYLALAANEARSSRMRMLAAQGLAPPPAALG